jgi:hypothetical protein
VPQFALVVFRGVFVKVGLAVLIDQRFEVDGTRGDE